MAACTHEWQLDTLVDAVGAGTQDDGGASARSAQAHLVLLLGRVMVWRAGGELGGAEYDVHLVDRVDTEGSALRCVLGQQATHGCDLAIRET